MNASLPCGKSRETSFKLPMLQTSLKCCNRGDGCKQRGSFARVEVEREKEEEKGKSQTKNG